VWCDAKGRQLAFLCDHHEQNQGTHAHSLTRYAAALDASDEDPKLQLGQQRLRWQISCSEEDEKQLCKQNFGEMSTSHRGHPLLPYDEGQKQK
jgi:invasion protein IalB